MGQQLGQLGNVHDWLLHVMTFEHSPQVCCVPGVQVAAVPHRPQAPPEHERVLPQLLHDSDEPLTHSQPSNGVPSQSSSLLTLVHASAAFGVMLQAPHVPFTPHVSSPPAQVPFLPSAEHLRVWL
jgi:hypothetical protein